MPARPCPICGAPASTAKDNPHRPFCSDRCRLLDLSRWLDESYVVPGSPASPRPDDQSGGSGTS